MLINSPNISGSLTVTGNATISGSLTVAGGISAAITGSATSASYVEYNNIANKPTLVSGSEQITYSGLSGIPSGIVSSSTQITGYNIFATTGSNQFDGSQAITGSLTVTGQVVAQTLNVQQVTSSIVFSSGSNIFGNSLSNTQQLTGSVSVTGSLGVAGAGTFSSNVGINGSPGTSFPLEAYINSSTAYSSTSRGNVFRVYNSNTGANVFAGIELGGAGSANDGLAGLNAIVTGNGSAALTFYTRDSNTFAERIRITSGGNVLIGSPTSDFGKLDITTTNSTGFTYALTLGPRTNVSEGDSVGISFKSKIAIGGAIWENARIATITENITSSIYGALAFYTMNATTLAERMRITPSGNIGIGTVSPSTRLQVDAASATTSSTVLTINGSATGFSGANDANTGYSINFDGCAFTGSTGIVSRTGAQIEMLKNGSWNQAAAGQGTNASLIFKTNSGTIESPNVSERMRITSGGDIFINNSSGVTLNGLTNKLSVSSTSYNLFDISRFSDNAFGPNFYLVKSRNGSIGGNTIVANGDNLGNINWVGANGTGFTDAASIKAEVDGAPGASNMPGRLVFSTTADGATSVTERMRITSGGLVGIGNDSPSANGASAVIDVGNGSGGTINLRDTNTGLAAEGFHQIYGGDNRMYLYAGGSGASAYMQFYTNDAERMRITSGGAIVHEGLNVRKTKSGGTSVTFTINLAATGYWAPGYATIRVAASRGGLQEHYAAIYFLRITYYQGSTSAAVYNIGGDTGAASLSVSGDFVSSQSQITITVSDAGATTDYLIADLDASFQTGIASIT